jgi:hypothetical protein
VFINVGQDYRERKMTLCSYYVRFGFAGTIERFLGFSDFFFLILVFDLMRKYVALLKKANKFFSLYCFLFFARQQQ